ncbi:cell wall-binding repeat-containing protein [Egibacter rhizosphaerae]|uniref:cell wall-binding repeat-containing protein n=1 Tax=Egibacter rhizosphaerae TaxID=1670831 RepID=UPI00197AEA46|nr:cell wall-binding repeat-containing protein [Egibacter rhizosphaerae]
MFSKWRRTLLTAALGGVAVAGVATAAVLADADHEEADAPDVAEGSATAEEEPPPTKSIGFYVGSDLTDDGSTLLGGFGHEPSSHWLEIIPRQEHPAGSTTQVGVTEDARIPGELIEIPQAEETNKYISSLYSEFAGFPPPLTNGGLNDQGVAARDIWSPSRPEIEEIAEEEEPQEGPQYSDLARAAMERASTAEEAVDIVGGLMEEHGYSTYGGNSHLFADEDEGWVFINYAHPDGELWAAERLGSDEVRVSYPGYIRDFPADHEDDPDFKASDELVDFAVDQGWYDPAEDGETLDLLEVFGVGQFPADDDEEEDYVAPTFYQDARDPEEREEEVRDLIDERGDISLEDMLALVRDPRWSTDHAGYGQVAHLRPDTHEELQTLWTATTSSVTTPYVPIPIGAEEVPPEFRQHRYMTSGSPSDFLSDDYQAQEGTRYGTREFKRLMYLACEEPGEFYTDVTGEIEDFELDLLAERDELESQARELFDAGDAEAARELLTENVGERLLESMDLAMALSDEVEDDLRTNWDIREPEGEEFEGDRSETTPPASQDMGGPGTEMVNCYDDDLHADYPRTHGAYTDVAPDPVDRISGDDRIETALELARTFDASDEVVIGRADDYADALAGGPLAAAGQAPLLLTPQDGLREDVATEIDRLRADTAHVLGGEAALSEEVEGELEDAGITTIERHEGENRFATTAAVADALDTDVDTVFLVEGDHPDPDRGWPDAVSVSTLAAYEQQPILLALQDHLPEGTEAALEALDPDEVVVVGGSAAVSDEVAAEAERIVGDLDRLSGENRYETSAAVADRAAEAGIADDHAWVASGHGWADSLAAAPVAGATTEAGTAPTGNLLLVDGGSLDASPATRGWVADRSETLDGLTAVGGTAAIDDAVLEELGALLEE